MEVIPCRKGNACGSRISVRLVWGMWPGTCVEARWWEPRQSVLLGQADARPILACTMFASVATCACEVSSTSVS